MDVEYEDIVAASAAAKEAHNGDVNQWKVIFSKRYIPQLVLCIALPIFNQLGKVGAPLFLLHTL